MKRCDYKRTALTFGPRGGVKAKTWRCSRNARHPFTELVHDENGDKVVPHHVMLCTQHLTCARNASGVNT